ncbi:MAG: bifunctional UDP-N-acetylmuramoyl-tripeptide:D-alanyl-D-alanine ligase/alanine racemase [Chitinophagaceae bacterium]|nr:bifunctional UDP-N-acetylmuramoyl-tripeptide:D-alanyl-D-alanine ligase/alanine racemase [Chitinophagaceae bacterium]
MDVAINYTIERIAAITNGKVIQHNSPIEPSHILLDSRKLLFPQGTIFFSLSGSDYKGTFFIKDLYEKEVRCFVIDNTAIDLSPYPDATFILVGNVLHALHLLAIHHRSAITIPVIGITGSNGKTIVKEWLYQLLEGDFNIVRSPKSYNSQIGVPLSVLQMDKQNSLAIFEAGISKTGEMDKIEKIIQPTIGVFTNIGDAHSEGFETKNQKIKEKLTLFEHSSSLIFCIDNDEIRKEVNFLKEKNQQLQLFTWSRINTASLQISSIKKENNLSVITGTYRDKEIQIIIPFTDDASIENAITCWCVLLQMEIADRIITERILQLHPVEMRLELKNGINNCSIINDSYSADINSLKIALDFLQQQQQHKKQTVILSDILQSGKSGNELYGEVASLLKQKKIQRLIAIGPTLNLQQEKFSFLEEKYFYVTVDEFKTNFNSLHFKDETILLKGARIFEFEQIGQLLEQKVHQTILSINLNSIAHNLKQYQSLLKPSVKIMAMVKAFSYGSGSYEIANLLRFNNVDYLAVAYADEGVELRKAGIGLPIMVMNPEENTFNALVKYNLEPEIFSFSILLSLEKYLDSSGIQYFPVHIKLDTGMHRLGFEQSDITVLAAHLKNNNKIKVQSVFSHLVASDDKSRDGFTQKQAAIFLECCDELQGVLSYNILKHIANTSAISRHPYLHMDMVRLGIGLYGIDGNAAIQKKLKNVSTLTTTIAQVKNVRAGESVGYGCEAVLEKESTIATVRIGYADGYPRALSNGTGKMLVQNKLVPVVGNVCMDMTMLDITGMNCKEGHEVIVFGEQLPIQQIAKWCNTISYEIMTGVSQRVKRIYFEE